MTALRLELVAAGGSRTAEGLSITNGPPRAGVYVAVPSGTQIVQANRPAAPALPSGLDKGSAQLLIKAVGGPLYVKWAETQAGADLADVATARAASDCKHLSDGETWCMPADPAALGFTAGTTLYFNAFDCASTGA